MYVMILMHFISKNTFNNNFVDGIRFLNMHPGQKYLPHVDSNEQGFHKDIPMDIQHPGNVNILLSTPVGDTIASA